MPSPTRSPRRLASLAAPLVSLAVLVAACSSSGGESSSSPATTARTSNGAGGGGATGTTAAVARAAGPAARLTEITAAGTPFLGAVGGTDLATAGYVEHEHVAEGTATSYATDGPFPEDGRIALRPDQSADYRTRIVVRSPADPADFNGTVAVEWLNVSGGVDANPDYAFTSEEMVRRGMAWVGVSAQHIGVEGGPVAVDPGIGDLAGKGLKKLNPERYGTLSHPGDAFAYDIYTQVGRALRGPEGSAALGGLPVERLLAMGESQSAFALTTYVDGVQPLTNAYDGFLVHSRGGPALPLGEPGKGVAIADAVTSGKPVRIRDDVTVPVLMVETETDLVSIIGYHPARQPDTDKIRLWEIAGTAHADASTLGPLADSMDCGVKINTGPQRFVVRSAVRHLDEWMRTGKVPPPAPRLEVDVVDGKPTQRRDADANALGGIRTPQVDVPVATLSGDPGPSEKIICLLLGKTVPFMPERLAQLYPSAQTYTDAYVKATDAAVASEFVVAEDRAAIVADAQPSAIPG